MFGVARSLTMTCMLLMGSCGGAASQVEMGAAGGATMDDAELALSREVFDRVNATRASQAPPLGTLTWQSNASQVAYEHALDMRSRGYFAHESPEGADAGDRLTAAGLGFRAWGENLGRLAQNAEEIVAAWMASPDHRAEMLRPDFTHVGTGVSGSGLGAYWTQVFFVEP